MSQREPKRPRNAKPGEVQWRRDWDWTSFVCPVCGSFDHNCHKPRVGVRVVPIELADELAEAARSFATMPETTTLVHASRVMRLQKAIAALGDKQA